MTAVEPAGRSLVSGLGSRDLQLVGVPFSSTGRPDGIAAGIRALRDVGLVEQLAAATRLHDNGDLSLEEQISDRGPSGLINEPGLASLFEHTRTAASRARRQGHRLLLVGGDCPVMLGALAALRDLYGRAALLMIDGHEDAWPPLASPTGEASDSELGIALGRVGGLPDNLRAVSGVLAPDAVALLGPRDARELHEHHVPSLAGSLRLFADADTIRACGPLALAELAVRQLAETPAWWLHIDLDVLCREHFPAADYQQPGGLTWAQLTELTARAWHTPTCAGASIVIYNAQLDPDREVARRTVAFIADVLRGARR